MNFFCIADKESSLGFRLTGVETREASSHAEVLEALRVVEAMENVGVVLITQKAASLAREEVENLTYRQQLPLVLEIPSRGEERAGKDIGEVLKKAIGISI